MFFVAIINRIKFSISVHVSLEISINVHILNDVEDATTVKMFDRALCAELRNYARG